MKKIAILTMILLSCALISCSKDEEPEDLIIGKWASEKYLDNIYEDGVIIASTTSQPKHARTLEFKSDGTMYITEDEMDLDFVNWAIEDDLLVLSIKTETYEILLQSVRIKELTSKVLVLYDEASETENGHDYKSVYESHYRKIK